MPDKAIDSRLATGNPRDPNRELDFLYRLGETIGATLDADLIPGMALKASLKITDADLGAVILLEDDGWRVAAASEQTGRDFDDLVARVVSAHRDRVRPAVITELPVASKSYSSLLWAPLVVAEITLGGILLGRRAAKSSFATTEMRLIAALAGQAAVALTNARVLEQTRVYSRHLQELNVITREIFSSLDVETVLERILNSACDLLGAVAGTLFLVEGPKRELVFRVVKGSKETLLGRRLPAGTGIVGEVASTRLAQIVNRVELYENWFQGIDATTGLRTRSILAVPLVREDASIGVLELINKRDESDFHVRDVAMLEGFAGQAVVALENARLHQHLQVRNRELHQAMRELQETQEQLIQKEKLASVGQLAAGVAHEINNPLSTILLYADVLCQEIPAQNAQQCQDLQMIMKEAMRCRTIVNDLLSFSRQNEVLAQPTDLNALLEEIVEEIGIHERFQGVRIRMDLDSGLPIIEADPFQLRQVFCNLMNNAADAMPGGGTLTLRTKRGPWSGLITAEVQDTGEGISEENMKKLFTPFFTTKPLGKGTGLGLSIIYGIVKMHRGDISVQSQLGQGTTFALTLREQLRAQLESTEASAAVQSEGGSALNKP
jgi:signal transduction histidine kinase